MLSANEIRNMEFPKSPMGGYKKADVDYFLEEVATAIDNMVKENAELIKKLQILAQNIEEYRNEEDSIKSALLNAQKTADRVLREANAEAAKVISDATSGAKFNKANMEAEAEKIIKEAYDKANDIVRNTEEKMKKQLAAYNYIKAEIAAFKTSTIAQYKAHVEAINSVPEATKGLKDYEAQAQKIAQINTQQNAETEEDLTPTIEMAYIKEEISAPMEQNTNLII